MENYSMENLKIHSEGNKDHLKEIREKYAKLKNSLSMSPKLRKEEKQEVLKKLVEKSKEEMQATNKNLY